MDVILLEKIGKLGTIGDQVKVKAGFGRNFLVPQGKAVPATESNIKEFEARRAELEAAAAEKVKGAQERADKLTDMSVTIPANAGDEGKLFGSVGPADIANALTEAGVPMEKSEINLPEGPLREVGEYDIDLQLHADISQTVKVIVIAERG